MDQLLPHNTYRKFASVYLTLVMMMHAALLYTTILLTLSMFLHTPRQCTFHLAHTNHDAFSLINDLTLDVSLETAIPTETWRTYLTFIAPTLRFGYPACRRFLQISSDLDFVLLHDFGSGPRVLRITASCLISFISRIWIEKLTSASV